MIAEFPTLTSILSLREGEEGILKITILILKYRGAWSRMMLRTLPLRQRERAG
jgi:hypothetical protein